MYRQTLLEERCQHGRTAFPTGAAAPRLLSFNRYFFSPERDQRLRKLPEEGLEELGHHVHVGQGKTTSTSFFFFFCIPLHTSFFRVPAHLWDKVSSSTVIIVVTRHYLIHWSHLHFASMIIIDCNIHCPLSLSYHCFIFSFFSTFPCFLLKRKKKN